MKNFFITTMLVFGLIACEETTSTTTEVPTDATGGVSFTGVSDEQTTPAETVTEQVEQTTETETETSPTETETETTPAETGTDTTPAETEVESEQPTEVEGVEEVEGVTLDDLTAEQLAEIDVLRENIFAGISVGEDLYINQVNLALEDLGLPSGNVTWGSSEELPEVSSCPFVEFYDNVKPLSEASCEYLVDQARSDAYSKLAAVLQTERENFNSSLSEQDFWYEQGAISGLEKTRVVIQVQMKTESVCNQTPTAVESSAEKGRVVGRQHFINSMNNWLTTNGHKGDYPVMSEPIEVCDANASLLDPVYDEALNTISQAVVSNPLCADYEPSSGDEELKFAQAQADFSKAIEQGIADEFALAAVKIFEVVPCNVSDPIILDLNNNGRFDITTVENGVNFSMFGKRTTAVSWLSGDGFLFVDLNSNGIADDGTEFFGTSTEYSGGFAHLATMDTNNDGVVSVKDKGFGNLYVWADTNYDGKCTTEEVTPLTETRVTSIPLDVDQYQKVSTRVNGNRVKSSVRVSTGDNRVILFGDVDLRSGIYPKLEK